MKNSRDLAVGFALFLLTGQIAAADLAAAADEKYRPKAEAHGFHWDYTLLAPYQGGSLRVSYALNSWFAYGVGGRTMFILQNEPGTSTRYLFSLMPVSQLIFRYPAIINNAWRPYFVSEMNYLYQLSDGRDSAGISGRGGIEFFASQNFAVAIEAGIQMPFYRNTHAMLPQGGIISILGAWYF
jgi:hypothetical protein